MNNFLDTCIVIAYFDRKDRFHAIVRTFVKNEADFVISEFQTSKEIPRLLYRKKRIIRLYIRSITLRAVPPLSSQEKRELKILLAKYSPHNPSIGDLKKILLVLNQLEKSIQNFLTSSIRNVIKLEDEKKIKKLAKEFEIENMSDAIIITYAVLEHQKNKLTLITLDKDWDRDKIKRICNRYSLNIPQLRDLRYESLDRMNP